MDVNIRDRRGEGAVEALLAVFIATVAGIIIFGLFPGILLTACLNYFFKFSITQLWGFSIIFSLLVYFILYYKFKKEEELSPGTVYLGIAFLSGALIGLSALFFNYNFAARTVMRMFDDAKSIPYEYLGAPSEINTELKGNYRGNSYNQQEDSNFNTLLALTKVYGNEIEGHIVWYTDNIDEGNFNRVRGTIDAGNFELQTLKDENNHDFTTKLQGIIENGRINCTYSYFFKNDKNKLIEQKGIFNGLNLGEI